MWKPQPGPQTEAIQLRTVPELFYGGAAGGGKSDFLLGDFLQDVPVYGEAWKGIIFRRTFGELRHLLDRSSELFPQTGAKWRENWTTWTWPNGATLRFAYLEADRDATRYQGLEFTWVGWDELTQWPTDFAYRYLRARCRSKHGVPSRIRATANPGGVGHHWVKSYFVSWAPGGYVCKRDPATKAQRIFVPAKLWDNKVLVLADPGYEDRLRGLGTEAQVRGWLLGDWNIVEGAFFDCWSPKVILRPTELPKEWSRLRSADWGWSSPFSIGWWAIAQDDWEHPEGQIVPRGSLVRYREWYGTKDASQGGLKGIKATAEEVGRGIVRREMGDPKLAYGVLDPRCFGKDGSGPSIAERINDELIRAHLTAFHEADNNRVPKLDSREKRGPMGGWNQMYQRIKGRGRRPLIYCFDTCVASIRTIPVLQHDPVKSEDVDTNSEDHAADEWRYACMSRPYLKHVEEKKENELDRAYIDAQEEFINDSILTL